MRCGAVPRSVPFSLHRYCRRQSSVRGRESDPMLLPQLCCGNNTLRRAVPSSHGAIPAGPAPIVPPSFSFPGGFVRNDIKRSGSPLRAGEKRGANRVPADGQNTVFPRKNASIVGKLCYPWSRFFLDVGRTRQKRMPDNGSRKLAIYNKNTAQMRF